MKSHMTPLLFLYNVKVCFIICIYNYVSYFKLYRFQLMQHLFIKKTLKYYLLFKYIIYFYLNITNIYFSIYKYDLCCSL